MAINLSIELQEELARIQNKLRSKNDGVRWVDPKLLHITLIFLGERDEHHITDLENPLRKLGENTAPFIVSLDGLGAFPSLYNPRVFWIGIKKGAEQLGKLFAGLEKSLQTLQPLSRNSIGKSAGKSFQPHITLGRRKKKGKQWDPDEKLFKNVGICEKKLHVHSFYLMQSTLYPTGPVYTPVREFFLKLENKQEVRSGLQNNSK